jgi:hypothetical protein
MDRHAESVIEFFECSLPNYALEPRSRDQGRQLDLHCLGDHEENNNENKDIQCSIEAECWILGQHHDISIAEWQVLTSSWGCLGEERWK